MSDGNTNSRTTSCVADDFCVIYSDLDLGLTHPALNDIASATRSASSPSLIEASAVIEITTSPSSCVNVISRHSSKCSLGKDSVVSGAGPADDMSSKPKVSSARKPPGSPNAPRRVSSKWHPSLIKMTKDKPPTPNPRSVSAERVRATRALYSSWHREMVAKSKDKITPEKPAPGKPMYTPRPSPTPAPGNAKTFLLGRRAVSESRFTIQDRELSPPPENKDRISPASTTRKANPVNRSNSITVRAYEPKLRSEKSFRGASASPPRRIISPRSNSPCRNSSPGSELGRPPLSRHTLSSKIKTKSYQEKNVGPASHLNVRSRSAEQPNTGRIKRHSCGSVSGEKKTLPRREKTKASSRQANQTDSKRLRQSESFDTTHSNETGYSSMLDLSPSPSPENLPYSSLTRSNKGTRTFDRKNQYTSWNPPSSVRRTLTSTDYAERRAKWETLSRTEQKKRFRSSSPPVGHVPLRSASLVRQATDSLKKDKGKTTDDRQPRRSRSLETVGPSPYTCPDKYRQYILEVRLAAPQSAKVSNLRRLFSSLDRVHNLKRSISSIDLTLLERRASYLLGFDAWKKLKDNERKALEYRLLLNELDAAQSNKDFLYCVTPEKKWKGDSYLRGMNESVSEIRRKFLRPDESPERQESKPNVDFIYTSGVYKGLWRAESVKESARNIVNKHVPLESKLRHGASRDSLARRSLGLWTSLSLEQVNALKDQLNDIYGSMHTVPSWRDRKKLSRSRSQKERGETKRETYDSVNVAITTRLLADKFAKRVARPVSADGSLPAAGDVSLPASKVSNMEAERKKLSKQLSMELKEKVSEQRKTSDFLLHRRALQGGDRRTPSISPDSASRMSPRTCYSLDISDSSQPSSLTSHADDQFFLVLQKPSRSRSLPPDLNEEEVESSDSDISVRTVIHKDVAGKVKFFEKRARKQSRSSERYSSINSRLSLPVAPDHRVYSATLPHISKKRPSEPILYNRRLPSQSGLSPSRIIDTEENLRKWKVPSEILYTSRDRSYDDHDTRYSRSYLKHVKTGDVYRLRERYESSERLCWVDKQRANSLPNLGDNLSRVTPSNRTVVRAQESGDVNYMRRRYEGPRKSRSPTRWVPVRDEYVPKNKLTSTLQKLGGKSEALYDPVTIERVSKRDSVEKSVLKRVHTGLVETTVGRLESNIHLNSGVSLLGHMYTSSPSLAELADMGPLVPPRPSSPAVAAPKKPLRLHHAASKGPLQTSTPTVSPLTDDLKSDLRVVTPPEMNRRFAGKNFPDYNAENHRPKSRYIPLDSKGAVSWTRSLERPKRLAKAIAPATFNDPATPVCTVSSFASSYFSCTRQMSIPSCRLSYSSSYASNPSRSSIASQGYLPPQIDHRHTQPSSLPYAAPSRVSSYAFQGELPEPENYYQYRPRASRYDCRSLSPPRSYGHTPDFYSPERHASLSAYSKRPLSQDYSHNRNAYLSAIERSSFAEARSLPGSSHPATRPLSPSRAASSLRVPPMPPLRSSDRDLLEPQYSRSRDRLQAVRDHNFNKAVTWKEPVIGPLPFPYLAAGGYGYSRSDSPYKYDTSEVNIHYKTPVRIEQKEHIPDEELARRQEEHMQRVYEQERRKKYLAEVEDIERRRHTDNFTPLQKSPIPLNRYDDDLLGGRSTSKQVARALFGFTAQNKRELSFNKGDIISVRRQIDKNWQEGELRGIVGIFPSNYVEILPAESIKSHVRKPSEGQARARFAFQAQTSMEMSLSKGETVILTRRVDQNWYEGRVGQRRGIFPVSYVDVLVEPGDKASPTRSPLPRPALPAATVLYNGVVPGTSSASSTLSGRSAGPQQQPEQPQDKATIETRATYNQQLSVNTQQESVPYRALYNYKPQNEDELELKEGDIVMVMEKCDDGWYVGTSRRTSLFGTFPGNYVERVA